MERGLGERSGGGAGRVGFWGKPVFWPMVPVRWPKVWRGGGWLLRDGRAHKRSRVQAGAKWSQQSLVAKVD